MALERRVDETLARNLHLHLVHIFGHISGPVVNFVTRYNNIIIRLYIASRSRTRALGKHHQSTPYAIKG